MARPSTLHRVATWIGRRLGAAYPRLPDLAPRDVADYITDALTDAWQARRWRGLLPLSCLLSWDLARTWTGRAALPLSSGPLPPARHVRSSSMDRLVADIRYSLRTLARTPGFTIIAVVTLALGIGSATAVYAVVDGVLLRPFTYPDMNRIVLINEVSGGGQLMSVSWQNFQDYVAQNDAFDELGVYRGATVTLTGGDQPERLSGSLMSSSVFATMGIGPLMGRALGAADDGPGAARVAVISERLWRTRYAGRPDIVGTPVIFDSEPYTIVGVMPAAMRFPSRLTDVWLPLGLFIDTFPKDRGAHPGLTAVGRVKEGLTLEAARASMNTITSRLSEQYPQSNRNQTALISSYYELIVSNIRPALYLLLGAVALLLVLACSNLASLMLARSEGRHREMAVRMALGAGRRRLLQQLLVEAAMLAVAGGAIGVGLAYVGVRGFIALRPTTVPRIDLLGIDWRVTLFAVAVSAVTAMLFGLLPAIRAASPDLQRHLKDIRSAGNRRAVRLRRVLVVAQVAVAAILLVGAGLLAKSLGQLLAVDLGFDPARVVTMRLALPNASYPSPEAWIGFHDRVLSKLAVLPGVDAIGLNSALPLEGGGSESQVLKEGDPMPSSDRPGTMCLYQAAGGEYFRALGISILRGRVFDQRDHSTSTPVAVVDETLVAALFGAEDPIGRRIAFEFSGQPPQVQPVWREVIGVVRHVKHYGLVNEPPFVQVYAPYPQLPTWMRNRRPNMALVVRTAGDSSAMVASIRRAVADIDSRIPVFGVQPMEVYVGQRIEQPRMSAALMTGFAALAALVASIGLYGVLSYLVSQRTREIGVRLALGAPRAGIVGHIVRQGLSLTVIGLTIGLAGALAAVGSIRTMLFGVSPTDTATFMWVSMGLSFVALVASFVPARRAALVDPLVALRHD